MAIRVVEFLNSGHKIRKVFAAGFNISGLILILTLDQIPHKMSEENSKKYLFLMIPLMLSLLLLFL